MREELCKGKDYLRLTLHEVRKYLQPNDYHYNNIRPHASVKKKLPNANFKPGPKKEPRS
jgi:hypothetical protein